MRWELPQRWDSLYAGTHCEVQKHLGPLQLLIPRESAQKQTRQSLVFTRTPIGVKSSGLRGISHLFPLATVPYALASCLQAASHRAKLLQMNTPCVCFPFLLDHSCLVNAMKSGEWAGWELGRRQGLCCMNLLPWLRPCETLVQSREDIGTHFSFNPISGLRSSFCNTALELQALHRCKHNSRGCPALW